MSAMAGLSHRQTEILNLARATGRVMVEDLARRFEVSAQTIQRFSPPPPPRRPTRLRR